MNKKAAILTVLRLYKWRLLLLALTTLIALVAKNYIAGARPPGGAPDPDIDPL